MSEFSRNTMIGLVTSAALVGGLAAGSANSIDTIRTACTPTNESIGSQPNETAPLPVIEMAPLAANQYSHVGNVVPTQNSVIVNTTLPKEYNDSIQVGANDPYVHCVMERYSSKIDFFVANQSEENGDELNPADMPDQKVPQVNLYFGENNKQADRIYKVAANIHNVLVHEDTHVVVGDWLARAAAGDTESLELLKQLNADYTKDTQLVYEALRQEGGPSIAHALGEVAAQTTDADVKAALLKTSKNFQTPNGLNDMAVSCPDESKVCKMNDVSDMVDLALQEKTKDFPLSTLGASATADQQLAPQDASVYTFFGTQYPDSKESVTIPTAVHSQTGHPFNNPNERVASSVASDNAVLSAVQQGLDKLSPERKWLAIDMRKQFVRFVENTNPGLLPYLNTTQIVH